MGEYIRRVISRRYVDETRQDQEVLPPANPNPVTAVDLIPGPPESIDPQAAPQRHFKKSPLAGVDKPFIKDFHSLVLAADTAQYVHSVSVLPDFWLVVPQLTAGSILVSIGAGQGMIQFRLITKTLRLPVKGGTTSLTINTVGATGIYDVYACKNIGDLFDIEA